MQVAGGGLSAPGADAIEAVSQRKAAMYAQVSASMTQLYQRQEFAIREVKQISEYGLKALAYVANSTKLSKEQKRILTRLIAIVDEFAGGSPKLMRDIIGIAKIMEMGATQNYKPQKLRDALKDYFEEREKLDPSQEVTISVETEINIVSLEYLGVSVEEALQSAPTATVTQS